MKRYKIVIKTLWEFETNSVDESDAKDFVRKYMNEKDYKLNWIFLEITQIEK